MCLPVCPSSPPVCLCPTVPLPHRASAPPCVCPVRVGVASRDRHRALSLPRSSADAAGIEEGKVGGNGNSKDKDKRRSTRMSSLATDDGDGMGGGGGGGGSGGGGGGGSSGMAHQLLEGERESVLRRYRRHRAGFWRSFWELSIR